MRLPSFVCTIHSCSDAKLQKHTRRGPLALLQITSGNDESGDKMETSTATGLVEYEANHVTMVVN